MSDEAATMAPATSDGTTTTDLSTASTDTGRTETSNAKQDLNSKNAMFFYHILASMENKPEVDWQSIAQKSGYKNAASAQASFRGIKKKLSSTEVEHASGIVSPKAAAKPRAKKEKAEKTVGSGTNTNTSKVTKKRAAPKKKSKAVKAEENDEDKPDTIVEDAQPVVDHNGVQGLTLEAVEAVEAAEVKDEEGTNIN